MIYRFLSAYSYPDRNNKKKTIYGRFGGAWCCGNLEMNMEAPKRPVNPKAKFYLTELGYRKFSKDIIRSAKQYKQPLKVIKRKNPKRSQVVFRDKYQVAILED